MFRSNHLTYPPQSRRGGLNLAGRDEAVSGPEACVQSEPGQRRLRILWFIQLDYESGMRHGGNLRFFNLSHELIAKGHQVYFCVSRRKTDEPEKKRSYLEALKHQGAISGYFEVEYEYSKVRGKISHIIGYPGIANRLLDKFQLTTKAAVARIVADNRIDLCLISDRRMLFLLADLQRQARVLIDWIDSFVLYELRRIPVLWQGRDFRGLVRAARSLLEAYETERYYGKRCAANLVVSPKDKQCFDSITKAPERSGVLLNGVAMPSSSDGETSPVAKLADQIIFTGAMSFPPNYEAALWFIEHVWPLLLKRRSGLRLVIAGANPVAELSSKAGGPIEVKGYVDDLALEIARSAVYVAPLISGGGFKNKVVEAIVSGTFVVATSMSVEFLDAEIRDLLLIADTPEEFAEHVLSYLDNPAEYEARFRAAKRIVERDFTWERRAEELIRIAGQVECKGKGA